MYFTLNNGDPVDQAISPIEAPVDRPEAEPGQRSRQQPGSACEECRRRKLRCDRGTPQCIACANSGAKCVVRSSCPPRGPRKGYLRDLQNKIELLQSQIKEKSQDERSTENRAAETSENGNTSIEGGNEATNPPISVSTERQPNYCGPQSWSSPMVSPTNVTLLATALDFENLDYNLAFTAFDQPMQDLSPTLGLEAYLTPIICADLDQLYFDRVHTFVPILQKFRYLSWARQPDKTQQKTCLQYTMWILAASFSSQFQPLRFNLYAEARQRLEALEADNQDNMALCIEQVQAWILLAIYELTSITCSHQRGMVSAGRAFRLAQLMRLNNIDGSNHAIIASKCQGQGDWIDVESMRRTFWFIYTMDRFTSALDGVPLTFNECQIYTRLPAPEVYFMSGQTINMYFLSELVTRISSEEPNDANDAMNMPSPFNESIIAATIWGRSMERQQQLHDKHPYQQMDDGQPLRALLLRHLKVLSTYLSSTSEHPDPMLLFVALTAYMAIFMLHNTTDAMPLSSELLEAVQRVGMLTDTLRQFSHFQIHPFTPIPLLLSARFFLAHEHLQNDSCNHFRMGIAAALEGLAHVNGLAKVFRDYSKGL